MKRDREAICKIISKMLDHPDDVGIYPTSAAYAELEKYVVEQRCQAIGWMYAGACALLDSNKTIRREDFTEIIRRAETDLKTAVGKVNSMTDQHKECCETGHSDECGMNNKSIYDMKLHDELTLHGGAYQLVTRVPGGWLYSTYTGNDMGVSSVFVPFNYEFLE